MTPGEATTARAVPYLGRMRSIEAGAGQRSAGQLPRAIVITGEPGSGKSSLGRVLAEETGFTLLDLDDLAPVEALLCLMGRGAEEIDDPAVASRVRAARYGALMATAATNLALGRGVVLVGPFSAERREPRRWQAVGDRLGTGERCLVYLDCPAGERRRRLEQRGSARDARKLVGGSRKEPAPVVDHIRVDGRHEVAEQLRVLLAELSRHDRARGGLQAAVGERTC